MNFLAKELTLSNDDIESLLVDMIMDNRINASIDQINGFVTLNNQSKQHELTDNIYKSLGKWADILDESTQNFVNRVF